MTGPRAGRPTSRSAPGSAGAGAVGLVVVLAVALAVGLFPTRPGTSIRTARTPSDFLRDGQGTAIEVVDGPERSLDRLGADGRTPGAVGGAGLSADPIPTPSRDTPEDPADALPQPGFPVEPAGLLSPYADSVLLPDLPLICNTPAPPDALHVATDGDDANPGTAEQPLAGISTAMARVQPGQTVLVRGGVYREHIRIQQTFGTPEAWITLRSYPGERAVIESALGEAAVGFRRGNAYITVACLTLSGPALRPEAEPDGPAQMRDAVRSGRTGPDRLPRNYGAGFDIGDLADFRAGRPANHHIRVVANEIHNYAEAGVGVTESNHISVIGNVISGNAKHGCHAGSGITLAYLVNEGGPDNADGYSNYVVGNVTYGNENRSFQCFTEELGAILTDGNGIIIDLTTRHGYQGRTLVADNVAFGNGGRGIMVFKSHRVDVINNATFDNARTPDLMGREGPHPEIAVADAGDVRVYNNVAVPRPGNVAFVTNRAEVDTQTNRFTEPGQGPTLFAAPSTDPAVADFAPAPSAGAGLGTPILTSVGADGVPVVVGPSPIGPVQTFAPTRPTEIDSGG